jgi:hypothetical protein
MELERPTFLESTSQLELPPLQPRLNGMSLFLKALSELALLLSPQLMFLGSLSSMRAQNL